jgi:methionyl-tRNA formyltransferase
MAHRALILGSIGVVPVAVMRAWIGAGNSVAAFWRTSAPGPIRRDRRRSWVLPRWSLTALTRQHDIPVRDVPRLASWPQVVEEAQATGADVLISVYFRYLIPPAVLEVFGPHAVNFHPAPLPRYRGPVPLRVMVLDRTILTDGAMTLHVLDEAFDTGPIVAREPVAFNPDLHLRRFVLGQAQAAARLTEGALMRYLAGELQPMPQDESEATYARVGDDEVDLRSALTADEIQWRCRTLARDEPLRIVGAGSAKAAGFHAIVGPPTGQPPVVGLTTVDFDAADARVRVQRKLPLSRQLGQIGRLVDLARTP